MVSTGLAFSLKPSELRKLDQLRQRIVDEHGHNSGIQHSAVLNVHPLRPGKLYTSLFQAEQLLQKRYLFDKETQDEMVAILRQARSAMEQFDSKEVWVQGEHIKPQQTLAADLLTYEEFKALHQLYPRMKYFSALAENHTGVHGGEAQKLMQLLDVSRHQEDFSKVQHIMHNFRRAMPGKYSAFLHQLLVDDLRYLPENSLAARQLEQLQQLHSDIETGLDERDRPVLPAREQLKDRLSEQAKETIIGKISSSVPIPSSETNVPQHYNYHLSKHIGLSFNLLGHAVVGSYSHEKLAQFSETKMRKLVDEKGAEYFARRVFNQYGYILEAWNNGAAYITEQLANGNTSILNDIEFFPVVHSRAITGELAGTMGTLKAAQAIKVLAGELGVGIDYEYQFDTPQQGDTALQATQMPEELPEPPAPDLAEEVVDVQDDTIDQQLRDDMQQYVPTAYEAEALMAINPQKFIELFLATYDDKHGGSLLLPNELRFTLEAIAEAETPADAARIAKDNEAILESATEGGKDRKHINLIRNNNLANTDVNHALQMLEGIYVAASTFNTVGATRQDDGWDYSWREETVKDNVDYLINREGINQTDKQARLTSKALLWMVVEGYKDAPNVFVGEKGAHVYQAFKTILEDPKKMYSQLGLGRKSQHDEIVVALSEQESLTLPEVFDGAHLNNVNNDERFGLLRSVVQQFADSAGLTAAA